MLPQAASSYTRHMPFIPLLAGLAGGFVAGAMVSSAVREAVPLTPKDVDELRAMPKKVDQIRAEVHAAASTIRVLENIEERLQARVDDVLEKFKKMFSIFPSRFGGAVPEPRDLLEARRPVGRDETPSERDRRIRKGFGAVEGWERAIEAKERLSDVLRRDLAVKAIGLTRVDGTPAVVVYGRPKDLDRANLEHVAGVPVVLRRSEPVLAYG